MRNNQLVASQRPRRLAFAYVEALGYLAAGPSLADSRDLTGADLTGTRFPQADLTGANLTGANLTEAQFTGADLSGARWPSSAEVPEGWQRDTDSGRLMGID